MGEEGMVREAMDNVAKLQKESGAANPITARNNVAVSLRIKFADLQQAL